MIKELNRSAMYYRGLENLTYNEIIEKKNNNLKWAIKWLFAFVLMFIMALGVSKYVLEGASEFKQGVYYGFCFFTFLLCVFDVFTVFSTYNQIFKLRIKEMVG